MKRLKLKNRFQANATILPNEFIDHYMVSANGEFVKVYLLLLRYLNEPGSVLTVSIGIGSEAPNKLKPNIYSGGLATIGEKSVIPSGVQNRKKYSHQRCYISGGLCWRST